MRDTVFPKATHVAEFAFTFVPIHASTERTCCGPAASSGPVVGTAADNADVAFHYVAHATGMKVVCACQDGESFPFSGARGYAHSLQMKSLNNVVFE